MVKPRCMGVPSGPNAPGTTHCGQKNWAAPWTRSSCLRRPTDPSNPALQASPVIRSM